MFRKRTTFANAYDPSQVGKYPEFVYSGGGYFYDEILEYRVWVRSSGHDPELHTFATYKEAEHFSQLDPDAEPPVVLVLQREYIDEPTQGHYKHVRKERIAEWQPDWLRGNRNTGDNVRKFLQKYQ